MAMMISVIFVIIATIIIIISTVIIIVRARRKPLWSLREGGEWPVRGILDLFSMNRGEDDGDRDYDDHGYHDHDAVDHDDGVSAFRDDWWSKMFRMIRKSLTLIWMLSLSEWLVNAEISCYQFKYLFVTLLSISEYYEHILGLTWTWLQWELEMPENTFVLSTTRWDNTKTDYNYQYWLW